MAQRGTNLWRSTSPSSNFPRLTRKLSVDVAVVGAGITGLSAALLLKRAGKSVAVVDMQRIAGGDSGRTTAHLTEAVDTRYHRIQSDFGRVAARTVALVSRSAIEQIAGWVEEYGISCGFSRVPGYLYTESDEDLDELKQELKAAARAGVNVDQPLDVPLPFSVRGAIRFQDQAQFHPREYLLGLAQAFQDHENHIFEMSHVYDIKDGSPCEVVTDGGSILAKEVLVTTHTPISNRFTMHTKIAPYRTYVIAARLLPEESRSYRFFPGLFWDTADPYHYARIQETSEGRFLIVGGEDHKTGHKEDTEECFQKLAEYVHSRFGPSIEPSEYRWSGQVMEPVDGLPYIGESPFSDHIYIATGFSGNGMTLGTVAGMLLSDQVLGRKSPGMDLFHPSRIKPLASLRTFIEENKDYPLCMVGDRLKKSPLKSVAEVEEGEGRIVEVDGRELAIYRDEEGRLHALSPVCRHMGCHVRWNSAETSWDCPCHGARYGVKGEVLNGPAMSGLPAVQVEDIERPAHPGRKVAA